MNAGDHGLERRDKRISGRGWRGVSKACERSALFVLVYLPVVVFS